MALLTTEDVLNKKFQYVKFREGYDQVEVDEFLDELTDDYTSLYKENAALKAKLKVLVDKVEEYRATEDSMRAALLTAQRMANTMVEEAEEKKKTMLAGAEDEARAKIGALQSDVELEQRRLVVGGITWIQRHCGVECFLVLGVILEQLA